MKLFAFFAISAVAAVGMAAPTTANFETAQPANFNVVIASPSNDASADLSYDSSTFVQANPTGTVPVIGPAPGASTTKVLRLNANATPGDPNAGIDAVNVYPNLVTPIGTDWSMQFDAWLNYNGPADGGSGSTEMMFFGAMNSNTVPFFTDTAVSIAGTGFAFTLTGDGGALADYRFYSGAGTISRNDAGATWLGGAFYNHLDTVWIDATTGFFRGALGYETSGAPGKAWITVKMVVSGTSCEVFVKRAGDAVFNSVATATVPAGTTAPVIGYSDLNPTQPTTIAWAADNFTLFDNLVIDNVSATVPDWTLY